MRIDKFLKVSRLIKRRTVAQEAASSQRITINGRDAKPATKVKIDDIVSIRFGNNTLTVKVLSVNEKATKSESGEMYEVIDSKINE